MNSKGILDVPLKYFIKTKRFDTQRYWFSLYVMALALILILKLIFVFCCYSSLGYVYFVCFFEYIGTGLQFDYK